jgi:Domain of unknown function (DUF3806)
MPWPSDAAARTPPPDPEAPSEEPRPAASPPPARVDALTGTEVRWVETQLAAAADLAQAYTGTSEPLPSLDRMAVTLRTWRAQPEPREPDVNAVVNALGIAFGEHLRRSTGLAWVIAADDQGTDLALHGQPGDILIYPANGVAERVVAGEDDFFSPLHASMYETVTALQAANRGG